MHTRVALLFVAVTIIAWLYRGLGSLVTLGGVTVFHMALVAYVYRRVRQIVSPSWPLFLLVLVHYLLVRTLADTGVTVRCALVAAAYWLLERYTVPYWWNQRVLFKWALPVQWIALALRLRLTSNQEETPLLALFSVILYYMIAGL